MARADLAASRARPCSTSISSVTPIIIGWLPRSEWRFSSCSGVFTVRRSAVCSWRSAKTNSAHASLAIQPTATTDRLRVLGDGGCDRGYAFGLQSSLCLGRAAGHRLLGRAHRHGGDRRDAKLFGAGARRRVLHSVPRVSVDLDAALAVLFRAAVHRLHRVFADRPRRRGGAAIGPVPGAGNRTGCDGRP